MCRALGLIPCTKTEGLQVPIDIPSWVTTRLDKIVTFTSSNNDKIAKVGGTGL